MGTLILAFIGGALTSLAPCVLPMLPIILGSSQKDKTHLWVVILSLGSSIFFFTLLLKVSLLAIHIPNYWWSNLSGGTIALVGIFTAFPQAWKPLQSLFHLSQSTQLLETAGKQTGYTKHILLGMALGPVFSSCSPVYLSLIGIIQNNPTYGITALITYIIGLSLPLFAIGYLGQKAKKYFQTFTNNRSFQVILGGLFFITGIGIMTGFDKTFEIFLLNNGFDTSILETYITSFFF